ncbi:TPA: hypothetical protein RU934_004779 [Escherichia coli]|nr:hypothetical protein [Escherichia coli]
MLSRNFVKSLFLLFFVSCVTEASKLTVNRETSKPVRFAFKAQCVINGWFRIGQSCDVTWTVPPGWRYTVLSQGTDDPAVCIHHSYSYDRMPGVVLKEGESLTTRMVSKITSMWLNSSTCWSGYKVEAVMVDDIGLNATMFVNERYDSDYKGIRYRYANTYDGKYLQMSIFRPYIGSRESITLDVQDKIDLHPGETKRLFTVDNGNTGKGTVSIIKSGEVAPYIEVYKNGASVKGCDGTYNIGGEYCEVRAVASPGWYGIKNGVINIRLTIN